MISQCVSAVDKHDQELKRHGTAAFPMACYLDDLSISDVPWHWHEELEVAVVIEGAAAVTIGSEIFTVGKGDGFFVNSGVLHDCKRAEAGGCVFHSIVFHPRLVGGSLESVFYLKYVLPVVGNKSLEGIHLRWEEDWQRRMLENVERAWQTCASEPEDFEIVARGQLAQLLANLSRHLPAVDAAPNARMVRNWERVKQMLQFIHRNYAEELTSADIATSACVSESECLRCFRATLGTTPIRYLREYRVQAAARRLADTQEPVAMVAVECGFQDVSYFTKTFREIMGSTPRAYRIAQG